MSEADETQFVMAPKEAARRLGVAPSTLRRLAPTYEAVHGPLLWEGNEAGGGRLWPGEAVERVQAARALVAEGRAKSLESALRALAGGAPPPSGVLARPDEALELVEALRGELEAVRRGLAELPELRVEVAALRSELAAARALPPGANPDLIDKALDVEMRESRAASERPVEVEGSVGSARSPGEALGGAEGSSDGPVTRAARWLERRLRGERG
jgi:hypothetical protein